MNKSKKKADEKTSVLKMEVADAEKAMAERYNNRRPLIQTTVKATQDGKVGFQHDNQMLGSLALEEALGTQEDGFFDAFLSQVANAACNGKKIEADKINFMLSVIKGIKPRDQVEAMLGAQMAAIHMTSMTFTRRLNHVETLAQQEGAEKALNKLMRTFTNQMEALRKYRSGGQQTVTVQHVQVNEGGQAVVGNINQSKSKEGG